MKNTCCFKVVSAITISTFICIQMGCRSTGPNSLAGGILGGTAGTVIGAAIGSNEGKTEEGAIIGAIAGGAAGAAIGNQADVADAQVQQAMYQQQAQAAQSAVTMGQVVQMSQSGLSDELIINQIQMNGASGRPTSTDLIQLKQNGVSDRVIGALQSTTQPQPVYYAQQPFAQPPAQFPRDMVGFPGVELYIEDTYCPAPPLPRYPRRRSPRFHR